VKTAVTYLINASDVEMSIEEGSRLGTTWEAELAVQAPPSMMNVLSVASNPSEPVAKVPEHLQDLLEDSAKELDPSERGKLAERLTEFQDVFARSEFDFGNLTALEHEIDIGDAHPIEERMRRTP
jgi:hypothetical protein